ncbi:MAG: patatin-like phospholipase family protein [Bacteroidota bacterium]|nr:patatin-like phospholipase family protein [Bacteroidota bacterium]
MNNQIENLVFKGGGVLGIAYAGAIEVLEQKNILTGVQRVAGTSAGAITAALVSLRYTSAQITNIVNQTDFKSFEDGGLLPDALHVMNKYGFYKGDAFLQWMQTQIKNTGLDENATFKDFENKGCRELHVFASDLNTKGLREFSTQLTPNVIVAEAVRASMSIPLFFEAWQFSNNNPDNHIYVDGGMLYNYPITIFDTNGDANPKTMGLFLSNLGAPAPADNLTTGHFIQYVRNLVDSMLDAQVINFQHDPDEEKRSVIIDNLGISPTNFKLTDDQKTALFNSGKKYATDYVAKMVTLA